MMLQNVRDRIFYIILLGLAAFILFVTQAPRLLESGLDLDTFRILGLSVSLLLFSIQIGAFIIYRREARKLIETIPLALPIIILSILFLYSTLWFGLSSGPKIMAESIAEEKKIEQASSIGSLDGGSASEKVEEIYFKFEILKRLEAGQFISDYDYRVKKSELLEEL